MNVQSGLLAAGRHYKHYYPQVWLLIFSLASFAFYIAWDLGLLRAMVALDRSYITLIIFGLLLLSTCHATWHILRYSQQIESLLTARKRPLMNSYSGDATEQPAVQENSLHRALEVVAEHRRAPVDLGWFLVDLAIRLGLVGTIIGFILIFTSLSDVSIDGADGLKELMIAMSGGMGTALFTTLCGLIAGTLMSFQYLILGRQTEYLIGLMLSQQIADQSAAAFGS